MPFRFNALRRAPVGAESFIPALLRRLKRLALRAALAGGLLLASEPAARAQMWTLTSPAPEDDGRFGIATASVPDLNGDGLADLIVAASGENAGNGNI